MLIFLISVVSLAFAYLAYRDFKSALTLLFALLPTYLIRFHVGPIPSTLLEVFVLILIGLWLFKHNGLRLSPLTTLGPYRVPILLLIAAACFSVVAAPDTFSALGVWKSFFVEPVILFLVLRSTFLEREDWTRALWFLGFSVIALGAFALFQVLTGLGIPAPWDIELRATSFFDFPNAVGLFVAPIVSALVVGAVSGALPLLRRGGYGGVGALPPPDMGGLGGVLTGLIAIILAQTEAAFVAIPAALMLTLLLSGVSSRIKAGTLFASIAIFVMVFVSSATVREKLFLQDFSGQVRVSQWIETVDLIKDHPLTGAGLAGYPTAFVPYHDATLYEIFQYPHTILFNFWVELGLLGVVALIAFIVATLKIVWMRRRDPLVLMAFAALATMTIHGLVDVPFFKNDLAILTVFFLAMMMVPKQTEPHHPEKGPHPLSLSVGEG